MFSKCTFNKLNDLQFFKHAPNYIQTIMRSIQQICREMYYIPLLQMFGVSKIYAFEKCLFCFPSLHLFDQKYIKNIIVVKFVTI